jgi:predicted permease
MVSWQSRSGDRYVASYPELEDWRAGGRTFESLAGFNGVPMNLADDRAWPEEARGAQFTVNGFAVLRQQPFLGRDFAADDAKQGAQPVAIIGYNLWRTRYGADPEVLGKNLRVNGRPRTIVGVMPEGMKFPENAEVWVPFVPALIQERDARQLSVFGRLKDGASPRAAEAELTAVARRLAATYPATNKDLTAVRVETFAEYFVRGPARVMFTLMMGAVTFVLVIACANVANLLLSRSAHRAREITVRMALGATRWRIVRQLLLESVVLAFIGGTVGLALALAAVSAFDAAVQDPGKPYWIIFNADYVVFGYVAGVCVVTAILSGLAPALHVSKVSQQEILRESSRANTAAVRARWFSGAMVVTEVALSIIMLIGAGLMVRSFVKLYTLDLGFSSDRLVTMRMQLPESKYGDAESRRRFFEILERNLAGVPGIEAVTLTTGVPPRDGGERRLEIDSPTPQSGAELQSVSTATISPSFFDVLGLKPVRGRLFDATDGAPGSETVLISERLASHFFPGEDPIGRRLRFAQREPAPGAPPPAWRRIVGVTPSIRQGSPQDAHLNPVVYVPYRQDSRGTMSWIIRSTLPTTVIADAVRREVHRLDPDQPVFAIQTLHDYLREDRWPYRVFGSAFAIFALIALALSSIGLYAVMAYSVMQRTSEIGMRMALGAQPRQVSWVVLKRGLLQLAIGMMLGLTGALGLSRVLGSVLVDIRPGDPVTFATITVLLTLVSLVACILPARQAIRIDPLVAIRSE